MGTGKERSPPALHQEYNCHRISRDPHLDAGAVEIRIILSTTVIGRISTGGHLLDTQHM
jgi:hypothetical protein